MWEKIETLGTVALCLNLRNGLSFFSYPLERVTRYSEYLNRKKNEWHCCGNSTEILIGWAVRIRRLVKISRSSKLTS